MFILCCTYDWPKGTVENRWVNPIKKSTISEFAVQVTSRDWQIHTQSPKYCRFFGPFSYTLLNISAVKSKRLITFYNRAFKAKLHDIHEDTTHQPQPSHMTHCSILVSSIII
ncbi:hypothetical protein CDL12_07136 [Handroanthus impetiginosus]|uniref:Uncharacterized protein n=1 Tax=Handroanthus impetiginosus TaxID=429701 RepID=A0A2G9HRM3_9LAMI|nr:hypothetical protein CDL12_07136 [Handroanthus impetiginosus]